MTARLKGINVDHLAQIIREVDGNNILGAGALAEAILEKLAVYQAVCRGQDHLNTQAQPHWVAGLADFCRRNGKTEGEIGSLLVLAGYASTGPNTEARG